MDYEKHKALIKDLTEVAKKHGVAIFSGSQKSLEKGTRHLQGYHMFFTFGEKIPSLELGGNVKYPSTFTIKLQKNRYKPENYEDDGN